MFGGFGGILPLRLGGTTAQDCWTSTQHARAAADLVAAHRSAPLATITFLMNGSTPVIEAYHGRNGSGLAHAPTLQSRTTGEILVMWASEYDSEIFEDGIAVTYPWAVRTAVVSAHWSGAPTIANAEQLGANTVMGPRTVGIVANRWSGSAWAPSDERITLRVFGDWVPEARIGDYDGAPDKTDCVTEIQPYAWLWYQEYEAMLGTAFTRSRAGIVHSKKLALARKESAVTRACERARANSLPETSDECLDQWVEALAIPTREADQRWQIRLRCAAKFRGQLGATQENVDASLSELLGPLFIQTQTQLTGDLDNPPTQTFWPIQNPGPVQMDLGGGAWSSERARLTVIVQKPAPSQQSDFFFQTNVVLFQQLDRMLPAKATFSWTTSIQGFLLDGAAHTDGSISQLDFDGLTPS